MRLLIDIIIFFQVDKDLLIYTKYDSAVSIGGTFLTSFLNKCRSRSEEIDFRPLFENFVHDLLSTVNKPEWPATELLLSLLGTMLVSAIIKYFALHVILFATKSQGFLTKSPTT